MQLSIQYNQWNYSIQTSNLETLARWFAEHISQFDFHPADFCRITGYHSYSPDGAQRMDSWMGMKNEFSVVPDMQEIHDVDDFIKQFVNKLGVIIHGPDYIPIN